MRRLIALFLSCLLGLAADAHAGDALLEQVLDGLAKHPAVRADFVQTRSDPALAQPQASRGKLLFVLGRGMLWQTESPYQETLALTGEHAARIDAQGNAQAVRGERGVGQIAQMLQSLLAGRPDAVLRQFDVQAGGSAAQWTLRFVPKQARIARVLGAITLDGGAYLDGIRIDMRDGGATDIRFSDAREAGALEARETRALGGA